MNYIGLAAFVLLTFSIWAINSTVQAETPLRAKLLWTLAITMLPGLGLLLWLFFGPKNATFLPHDG